MEIFKLREHGELADRAAEWFHLKWGIPASAYRESIEECLKNEKSVPQWYVVMEKEEIVGGLGVIENDFHDRKDLTPNVCAVYVEEEYRCRGIAEEMLRLVCEDMGSFGIDTLYLVTDHTLFYERYGWRFLCMVKGEGEDEMSRMYVHKRMKVIAVAAVTAGGKTTTVNELRRLLPRAEALYFDDYTFEGEVDDFYQWVLEGADYNVWRLEPLEKDIVKIRDSGECDYLILDYPFAYCNYTITQYIDFAVFIDTPLDVALARRILRDMKNASGDEIRNDLEMYLKYARVAFLQMQRDILPSSDLVIDGGKSVREIVDEIMEEIRKI